jgi:type I restriction enzyme S subunit
MREDCIECTFEDLLDYEQPTKYIVRSTKYSDAFKMPVLTAGKSFIKGYTNETDGIFDNLPAIIFDDFTTATQFVDFEFKVKSSAMKILVPTSKLINIKFLYNCIQVNQVRNDTHKRYWISVYAKKKMLLPPLVEQQAILAKTEELFSDLDNGIANFKKAQAQLKIYRKAVMKQGVDGVFTTTWRKNQSDLHQNLIDFITSIDNSIDLKKENHINWIECTFGDLLDYEQPTKYIVKSTKYKDEYKIPVLTAGKSFIKGYTNEIDGIFDDLPTIIFDDFTTASRYVDFRFKVKSSAMKILVPRYNQINMKFMFYCMQVNQVRNDTHKRYWISVYAKNKIFVPSPKEQTEIIQEIESRLSVCDKVEQSIKESILKAEALRQSILKKAFEGRLLSKAEIEECKKEADYEPASELLKKIKAEKLAKEEALKKAQSKKKIITKKKSKI